MTTPTTAQHIEITPGIAGGKPRIAGHRITVEDVVIWHERLGQSSDEIAAAYGLSLTEVHSALAYYFDHRAQIDERMAQGKEFVEMLRSATPSKLTAKLDRAP
jgi:uncharacterized protein (DUF433 family)